MPNAVRGEVTIQLAGLAVTLRPTFDALCETEDAAGVNIIALSQQCLALRARMRDVRAILAAGIKGAGGEIPADLSERIVTQGVLTLVEPLGRYLLAAIAGGVPGGNGAAGAEGATAPAS